jgi:hypothetical protein
MIEFGGGKGCRVRVRRRGELVYHRFQIVVAGRALQLCAVEIASDTRPPPALLPRPKLGLVYRLLSSCFASLQSMNDELAGKLTLLHHRLQTHLLLPGSRFLGVGQFLHRATNPHAYFPWKHNTPCKFDMHPNYDQLSAINPPHILSFVGHTSTSSTGRPPCWRKTPCNAAVTSAGILWWID